MVMGVSLKEYSYHTSSISSRSRPDNQTRKEQFSYGQCYGCEMWLEMTKSKCTKGMLKPQASTLKATMLEGLRPWLLSSIFIFGG